MSRFFLQLGWFPAETAEISQKPVNASTDFFLTTEYTEVEVEKG